MIERLAGVLEEADGEGAVLDVHGVGYRAFCSTRTLGRLPQKGAPVRLFIETHMREDHIRLYGFIDVAEREWFRLLLRVQGVGARVALSILSALAPDRLRLAMHAGDKKALALAEGVGPRLAARILNELKDTLEFPGDEGTAGAAAPAQLSQGAEEALSALVNLGFGRSEALAAVGNASESLGGSPQTAALIRASLKELAR